MPRAWWASGGGSATPRTRRRPSWRSSAAIRRTGETGRSRFDTRDAALAALEARLDELARSERRRTQQAFVREFAPVQQVAARGEIAGAGGLRGGVDLRGDGSAEAFTGRW